MESFARFAQMRVIFFFLVSFTADIRSSTIFRCSCLARSKLKMNATTNESSTATTKQQSLEGKIAGRLLKRTSVITVDELCLLSPSSPHNALTTIKNNEPIEAPA